MASPEFKLPGSKVVYLAPETKDGFLPDPDSLKAVWSAVEELIAAEEVLSAWTPGCGGVAEGLFKMCLGNRVGFKLDGSVDPEALFGWGYGGFILELAEETSACRWVRPPAAIPLRPPGETLSLEKLQAVWEDKLEPVLPYHTPPGKKRWKRSLLRWPPSRGGRPSSAAPGQRC